MAASATTFAIDLPQPALNEFCVRWRVRELALFGSVLRDDFRPDSDIDVLISFDEDAPWSLWDLTTMQDELAELFGRPIDIANNVQSQYLIHPPAELSYRCHHVPAVPC